MKKIIFKTVPIILILTLYCIETSGQDKIDYISKVPKFNYPSTLDSQVIKLENDPLLIRFAESRRRQSVDRFRPIYHFVSPESTLNDPNGLCFWNGNWHLFYQAYPPEDRRQHWGHTISEDLVHWKDLPYAIYPSIERAVFSGTTYVDDDKVIAIYHGTQAGNMVAISSDPLLLNWEKTTKDRAAIPLLSPSGFATPYTIFDPAIWKEGDIYYSLSAGREPSGPGSKQVPVTYLFRSKDLANWQYMHKFVEGDIFTQIGDDYACPYFWPIGDRHILIFYSHMSGGQYLLGDYDKDAKKFNVTSGGKFNFGASGPSGVHAPSVTPDGHGGLIVIFNMNPGKPTGEWNQIFSLARRLTLVDNEFVYQEPAGDIESLRGSSTKVDPQILPANKEVIFKNIKGNAMEISLEIDPKEASAIEIDVLRSPKKEEYTGITFYRERGLGAGRDYRFGQVERVTGINDKMVTPTPTLPIVRTITESVITLTTAFSSIASDVRSRPPEIASFSLDKDETLKLRIFIDKSVVEVFANGKQCVAARVYPDRDDSIGFSIRSQGQSSELISLEAWQMNSIWE